MSDENGDSPVQSTEERAREQSRSIGEAADADWPLWELMRENARGDRRWGVVGVLGMFVAQLLSNADMFVIGLAFDAMFNDRPYALPLVPEGWIPGDPAGMVLFTAGLLVAMKAVDVTCGITSQFAWHLVAQRVQHRVRVDAFDTVQRLEMGFFDSQQTGEIMSVLNNDVNNLEEFLTEGPNLVVVAVTVFATSIGYMALLNWKLALVSLAIAPVVAGVNFWFGKRHEDRQDDVRTETGVLNALLETTISGVGTVKAFGGERYETGRVDDASGRHRDASWRGHLVGVRHQPSLRLLAGVAFLLTFLVGTEWVLDGRFWIFSGTLTAGELVPFLYYTQNLVMPMRIAAWVTGMYKGATAAAKRVVGVQRLEPPQDAGGDPLGDVDGRVTYDDVSFTYPGTDEPVLRDIDLDVAPGETVGLVGHTGAGKSTMLKLLLRFYDPGTGTVRVDGRDLTDCSLDSLRQTVGYVAQDPFLFAGTVRENVAYGVPNADDAAIETAAKQAGAHEFVSDLDDGYDTEVGERGVKLSGGQRQRIALARVLLKDPPILVLDEATSHVDNRTELLIQRTLDRLTEDRTTIVVAHRLSTVRDADRIVHLDNGEITEVGTHEDLLDRDGDYAALWRVQVGDTRV